MSAPVVTRTVRLAQQFNELEQPQKALETLKRATADERETVWFWYVRASASLRLRKLDDMQSAAEKGLSIDPEATFFNLMLAFAAENRKDFALAEKHLLIRLRDEPEDADALCQYANLLVKGGDLDKAEKVLDRAAALDPEAGMLATVRGKIAYLRGDTKGAVKSTETALQNDPESVYARTSLGGYLTEQGKISQANRHFRNAARSAPDVDGVADVARAMKVPMHPLLYPLRILDHIPTGIVWAVAVGTLLLLNATGYDRAASIFAVVYLIFVAYSWLMPPVVRWWVNR